MFLSTRHVYTMEKRVTSRNISSDRHAAWTALPPPRGRRMFGTKVDMGKRAMDQILASKYGAFRKWRGKDNLHEASRDIHANNIICIFIHFRTLKP